MARTTAAEVKQIIDTDLSDTIVDAYIGDANALVTNVLGDDTTLGDTLKESIEKWLTAHMIASTRERMGQEEEAGSAKIKYVGKTGLNLSSTAYGQMVLTLDSTGNFASLGGKKASIYAVTSFE
jgi:hypothetical protein